MKQGKNRKSNNQYLLQCDLYLDIIIEKICSLICEHIDTPDFSIETDESRKQFSMLMSHVKHVLIFSGILFPENDKSQILAIRPEIVHKEYQEIHLDIPIEQIVTAIVYGILDTHVDFEAMADMHFERLNAWLRKSIRYVHIGDGKSVRKHDEPKGYFIDTDRCYSPSGAPFVPFWQRRR